MASLTTVLLSLLVIALLLGVVTVGVQIRLANRRRRPVVRVKHVYGSLLLVLAVVALGIAPLGPASFGLTYQVAEQPDLGDEAVPVREPAVETVTVPVDGLPGTRMVVRADGATVRSWEQLGDELRVTVEFPAREKVGQYEARLTVTPYPAVLPASTLESLHDRSPAMAAVATAGVIVLPLALLGRLLLDGDRPLHQPRNRWLRRRLGERP